MSRLESDHISHNLFYRTAWFDRTNREDSTYERTTQYETIVEGLYRRIVNREGLRDTRSSCRKGLLGMKALPLEKKDCMT
jgi:hypothetical protein